MRTGGVNGARSLPQAALFAITSAAAQTSSADRGTFVKVSAFFPRTLWDKEHGLQDRATVDCEVGGISMKYSHLFIATMSLVLSGSLSANSQTMPVPMPEVNYGPGRVDASVVRAYEGRVVSACGRVGWVDPKSNTIVIADILRVYVRANVNVQSFWGTVACAHGLVEVRAVEGGGSFAVISVDDPTQLEEIGGTGPYSPPRQQCGPGQMFDPSSQTCVKGWRASPYGGQ